MADDYAQTLAALAGQPGRESELSGPLSELLAVSGVAISTLGAVLGSATVSASDRQAARIDELQFDLGEGPCWDALRTARPVFEPDVRHRPQQLWPAFSPAIADDEVGAIFAFPLLLGPLRLGALDLYTVKPCTLSEVSIQRSLVCAEIISRALLRRALRDPDADDADETDPFSRRLVHQATGMVIAQARVSPEDAHLLIQGRAYATGRTMRDVAVDLVERRFSFSLDKDGIGDSL
ncbi:GAF and ANTAR domain-containing protein [Leifsonia poae]|uniref:GAF and ANTAR domain-containing protein n=1 Tax=Leifsonia poae TaxID=110933 RepID=UPI001CBC5F49|nr:ANTAR domain-containing protein [Leifsonia poae]